MVILSSLFAESKLFMSKARCSTLSFAIAHRGASVLASENTIAALSAAKKRGAQWVECDVQLTRDHHPVIFHDATVDRMTNGKGYVSQTSLAKIQSLDCDGEPIPTLFEWFVACRELKMNLNLEMKVRTKKQAKILTECVLRDLQKSRYPISKLLLSSFHWGCLLEMIRKNKKIRLAYNSHDKITQKMIKQLGQLNFFSVHLHYPLLNEKVVNNLHQHHLLSLAYTVNDLKTAKNLRAMGVDAIFTDNEKMYRM
jgi:glycerophosphoryl diester phosphodiesterase